LASLQQMKEAVAVVSQISCTELILMLTLQPRLSLTLALVPQPAPILRNTATQT